MAARNEHMVGVSSAARGLPRGITVVALALGAWGVLLGVCFVVAPFLAHLFAAL